MTQGDNACSFTVLPEPDPNIKKAFEVRLRPAITGGGKEKRKREDISDDNTLCNINFEIGCVD